MLLWHKQIMLQQHMQIMLQQHMQIMLQQHMQIMLQQHIQIMQQQHKQIMLQQHKQIMLQQNMQIMLQQHMQTMLQQHKQIMLQQHKPFMLYQMSHNMTKPYKMVVHPGKAPIWSESLLSAWRKLECLVILSAHSEDPDQIGWMPRQIWIFAGYTLILLAFVMLPLKCKPCCINHTG